jgi:hypothetical protein
MELRRVAPVLGLIALLAVDAVLIAWAFRPVPVDDYVPAASAASATSQPSTGTSKPKPSSTSTRKPAVVRVVPLEMFVSAVGPKTAWVTSAGKCDDPGRVWVTRDRGASWDVHDLPGRVLRLRPESATKAFSVGGDKTCSLALWDTINAGTNWAEPGNAAEAWSRDPDDANAVHTAANQLRRPCGGRKVVDLSVLDKERATVLCENGDVRMTTDGGQNWPRLFGTKNALAVALAEGEVGVVVKSDKTCAGVVAVPITEGQQAAEGECVGSNPVQSQVSVSGSASGWWLTVGKEVFTAEDNLGPWTATSSQLTD